MLGDPRSASRPGTSQWLARIALVGFLLAAISGCATSADGCSSEEAATFNEIEHYGGVELAPEDDRLGGCGATFTTRDDPELVIEHYRSELDLAGWAIDPPEPLPSDGAEMQSVSLGARKGTMGLGVSAEILGGPETEFVIHVREDE
jgi:hypothetical protein